MGVRYDGMGVCDALANVRYNYIRVDRKFGLVSAEVSDGRTELVKRHTLKT